MQALIIEDDLDISELIKIHLKDLNFEIQQASDGEQGLKLALKSDFDLIVLDLMLPSKSGMQICKELRKAKPNLLILILTVKSDLIDKVSAFEYGADDYLTKPFQISELLARVKALMRRQVRSEATTEFLKFKDLMIDKNTRIVTIKGKEIELSRKLFDLLFFLAKNPGRVFSRNELLDNVWGYDSEGYEHTVDSHINRLRAKIEQDPNNPDFIHTVWGVGYKFLTK